MNITSLVKFPKLSISRYFVNLLSSSKALATLNISISKLKSPLVSEHKPSTKRKDYAFGYPISTPLALKNIRYNKFTPQ